MGYREDDYRQLGIKTYGSRCEICGYGIVEVHHVDYKEHQEVEDYIRYLHRNGNDISNELAKARKQGYLYWKGNQLSKDDRSTNLSVLCPNDHTMVHQADMGMNFLKLVGVRV